MELLLLHGAIGDKTQFAKFEEELSIHYNIHSLNFSGHGGLPIPDEAFSISKFAEDVVVYLQQNKLESVHIFGYSMGGYVALYLAVHYPQYVGKVIMLATKFDWTPETAAKETKSLQPEKILLKLPAFAESLRKRHDPADWKLILNKTAEMMLAMGENNPIMPEEVQVIEHPVLVMVGDRDKMVSIQETINVYGHLPNGFCALLPATQHPIEQVNVPLVSAIVVDFLNS